VTALADRAIRRPDWATARLFCAWIAIGLATAVIPAPAKAQVGAVVSLYSDDRFRGVSVSDGRPVGILDLSYDASNGLYAGLSGSVVATRHESLKALSVVLNGGYAKRLRPGLMADIGFVHSRYSHYSGVGTGREYNEIYAAVSGKLVGARVSVSPNYLGAIRLAAHGEVFGHLDLTRATSLDGDLGVLLPVQHSAIQGSYRPQLDGRLGVAHRIGPMTLHADVTGRTGSGAVYSVRGHRRVALVLGISRGF
jgi:uncharacterized protein (TIGR02001 family)